jgi:hypothetical protein
MKPHVGVYNVIRQVVVSSRAAIVRMTNHLAAVARTADRLSGMVEAFARHHRQEDVNERLWQAIEAAAHTLPRLSRQAKEAARKDGGQEDVPDRAPRQR